MSLNNSALSVILKICNTLGDEENVVLVVAVHELLQREPRFSVHNINLKREKCGEFFQILSDLLEYEAKFFKLFRMTTNKFFLNWLKFFLYRGWIQY